MATVDWVFLTCLPTPKPPIEAEDVLFGLFCAVVTLVTCCPVQYYCDCY